MFQAFNLLPSLTVEQNITLPLRLAGRQVDAGWYDHIVKAVDLGDRLARLPAPAVRRPRPEQGGDRRALVTRPEVCRRRAEPGALDPETAQDILGLLRQAVTDLHQTVVMVTHDPVAAAHTDHALFLSAGHLVDALTEPSADRVADVMAGLRRAARCWSRPADARGAQGRFVGTFVALLLGAAVLTRAGSC